MGFSISARYSTRASNENRSNQVTWRIDHELRPDKDRLYAYYYRHTGSGGSISPWVRPDFIRYNPTKGNFGNVNWTHILVRRR